MAGGADPPICNFGFVEDVAVGVGGRQARSLADSAVDIADRAAAPADDVVVVICDAKFVEGRAARRFDAPCDTRSAQSRKHVVHRLVRDGADAVAHLRDDRFGVGMRLSIQRFEHAEPG